MDRKMQEYMREKMAASKSTDESNQNQEEADPGEGTSRQHHRGPFTTTGTAASSACTGNPGESSEPRTIFLHRRSRSDISIGGSSTSSTSDLSARARNDYSQHSDDGITYDNRSESSSDESVLNAILAMGLMTPKTHPVVEAQRSEGVLDLRKKLEEEKEYRGPVKRQKEDKDKDKEPPSSSKKSKRKD